MDRYAYSLSRGGGEARKPATGQAGGLSYETHTRFASSGKRENSTGQAGWHLLCLSTQPVDLVLARQAEGVQDAGVLLREEGLVVGRGEQRVARADVDAAARDRGARPDRAEVDLLEHRAGGGVEGDQLAAGDGREVDDAVGDGDPRGDRVADVGEDRLRRRPAERGDLGPLVPPALRSACRG